MGKKFTIEMAQQFVRDNSSSELLSTEWKGSQAKMDFKCHCGQIFTTTYNRFQSQNKRECFACASKEQYDKKRLSQEDAVRYIESRTACTYVSGEYRNQNSSLKVRCSCGREFESTLNRLVYGHSSGLCPSCGIALRNRMHCLPIGRVREVAMIRGADLISEEYVDAHSNLRFRCECGREFETSFNRFVSLGKTRCTVCSKRESKGEMVVRTWLQERGIKFVAQKSFEGCGSTKRPYFFDFYLPEHNTCIEFDGEQHFRVTAFASDQIKFEALRKRDEEKDAYCEEQGIRLIRIPYWNIEYVDMILESTLMPR